MTDLRLKARREHRTISLDMIWDVEIFSTKIPKSHDGLSGIYFVFNKDNEVIYVGQSINVYQRAKKYYNKNEYAYLGVLWMEKKALNNVENTAIRKLQPKYNRVGTRKQQYNGRHKNFEPVSYWV